ncbi:hypothetical protein PTNB73_06174 [Pyrenophora teres f. teres]|uniref:Uncharacterized protein n=1 Tax=Pyrenophora teres f. teres TaxID=97479 RepID=A0A6S6WAI2_9PLEO|nr:hypothetical protein PTNB85_07884 [Pyrenophora teres f. teres]KAE8829857.1 hypothetical protein HRS9139_06481 [Pyrenophora teres f. teres]KAE8841803.1 hypothetical protein HRS9122_05929 [Pyrenophora teres f. teres]KAE8865286.1 hypothetical protein PTNB73_06174 [Pyrenophora teres f. teres]CAE7199893.1 hypothetical protein PTTW11_08549 [Pyrenophora teres f. teres]
MQENNIETTPLGPLTWETPELRELYKIYWQVYRPQICRDKVDPYRQSAYDDFYEQNGYLVDSMPSEHEMLNNDIHPIFDKSNWVVEFDEFDEWYTEVSPALQLASMFLSHPYMLKFWIHLKYGHPGFENGWVCIEEDPMEHDPNILEKIKDELRLVADKVKFAFRVEEDMEGFLGSHEPDLLFARSRFEDAAMMSNVDYPKGVWYNPWSTTVTHNIFLPVHEYREAFRQHTSSQKLENNMQLAMILMHELAHAYVTLWQPSICKYHEPVLQGSDKYPEAGVSWEKFAIGGFFTRTDFEGPTCWREWDHACPSTTTHDLPIAVPLPTTYFSQWFCRDTWEHLTERLDHLRSPSIIRNTDTYLIKRLRGNYWEQYLIVDHEPWPAAHLGLYAGHPLEDEEYSPEPGEPSIPTTAADIISRYEKIHALDVARFETMEDTKPHSPHCYWKLTKLCCPYSQINQLADNALNPADGATQERYFYVDGCLHCWQLAEDEDHPMHPVPYSRRVKPEYSIKRMLFTRKNDKPLRCGLPQKRTARRPAGRSITKAKLEHVDSACVTPDLEHLFRKGTGDGEAIGCHGQSGLHAGKAVGDYAKVRTCGLLMMISEPISRLADWLHLR